MIVAMVEDSEEIVFQRLVAYKAFNIRLLNLQLRWGIAVTNALKLDRMDRLCTTLSRMKDRLVAHHVIRKISGIWMV